jgi:hypothetical protein
MYFEKKCKLCIIFSAKKLDVSCMHSCNLPIFEALYISSDMPVYASATKINFKLKNVIFLILSKETAVIFLSSDLNCRKLICAVVASAPLTTTTPSCNNKHTHWRHVTHVRRTGGPDELVKKWPKMWPNPFLPKLIHKSYCGKK